MSKCISCQAELVPGSRFCGVCGTTQPSSISGEDPENMETLRSNPPSETIPANIPPPPPQPNFGGIEKREMTPSGLEEYKLPANSSPAQPHNPPSGPHSQPQPPNLQQPYSNYQPAPPTVPPSYGGYQYGQQSQPGYGGYQQPYGQYQQPAQPYATQPYNDYPQPPQLNDNYQQPQYSSGAYPPNSVTTPNTGPTGAPPLAPGLQQPKPKPPAWRMWAIIGVVVVVILAVTGILAFRLIPRTPTLTPTISVTSDYHDNNGKPAGATNTTLHVQGKQFAANSTITLLFDSAQFKQDMQPQSDASGAFNVDLTVPSDWSTGSHTLTARDASNNITATGADINIVPQGYNGTPGPNGAPTNTATFKISLEVQMSSFASQYELDITGQSDSQGGKVCSPGDDGSQQKSQYTSNGTVVTETSTYTCTGTYKNGKVTYDDTLDTRTYTDDNGGNCSMGSEQTSYLQITGTYTTSNQFSGTITLSSLPDSLFTCTGDLTYSTVSGDNGTWTGGVSNS